MPGDFPDQALGCLRGGLSSNIHLTVRGFGSPVRFVLTASQRSDAPQADALIADMPAEIIVAAAAYDREHLRKAIADKGAQAVIPNNPSRALKYPLDKTAYKERHFVESFFAKLQQFRRVATSFEKTARKYAAVITLADIVLWFRYRPMAQ